jgi:hypothetical protein
MSILNSIQEAEAKAESLKKTANEQVSLLLENNKKAIEKKVAELYLASDENLRQIEANTDIVISNMEKKIKEENLESIKGLQKKAYLLMDDVVDDVIKKVLQI